MNLDLSSRFGFLVNEVGRLYGRQFDQRAREALGVSRAQCRLLAALAADRHATPSQASLAEHLDLTPMAVKTLCDRMEAAGWIRRAPSTTDRRANHIVLQPKAQDALAAAIGIGDGLQAQALGSLSAAERAQLMRLLTLVRSNLVKLGATVETA